MSAAVEAAATVAAAIAASATLGAYLARRDPGPLAGRNRASRHARNRAQDQRDLLRLTRNAHRKDRTTVKPGPLANDERSPDWCHRHGCHRSACPGPE
jgi:hypothetical protein